MKGFFRFTIRQIVLLTATVAGCVAANRGNDPRDVVDFVLRYDLLAPMFLLSVLLVLTVHRLSQA